MSNIFRNQKDVDESYKFLVDTTVRVLKIDRAEAEIRVKALFRSGILENNPQDPKTSLMIDAFLAIPSSEYGHLKTIVN